MKAKVFPNNVEVSLLTIINFSYITFNIPFKVEYDENKKEYRLHNNLLRKVICSLRLVFLSIIFFHWIFFNFMEEDTTGPLSVLLLGIYLGGYFTAMFYLSSVLSTSFQKRFINFINFMQQEDPCFAKPSSSNRRWVNMRRDKFYLRNEALFYYFLSVIIYFIFTVTNTVRKGLDLALERTYNHYTLNGPMSILRDYPSLKRTASYIFLWFQFDQESIIGTTLVFSLLMAKTLEVSVAHFVRSVNDNREYCRVSKEEIIERFQALRKAFESANNLCKFILCSTMVTQSIQFAVGIVWILRTNQSLMGFVGIYAVVFCFVVLLRSAAKASSDLARLLPLLIRYQPSGAGFHRVTHVNSLKEHIMAYEINAGEIGFGISSIFLINYSFIGSVAVGILSNSALAMQASFEGN